ncbi:VOC family protein [Nonomuraea sp. NN258]|uniref:VOC family protein n=1 Tax=Nonomuraea antri TaxID=2730852 RepID=UPI001569FE10|nr:VOC family protein [Nonomuraea antri]NRQ38253.1 VOC family protein [Nonomuraea antri]
MLTTSYVPGSVCWIDAVTPDLEATTAFYTGLFGWTAVSLGPEHHDYRLCQVDGRTVAGIGRLGDTTPGPLWLVYFQTPDADAVAKAVEQAGGTVHAPPYDIPGQGRMATFADTAGATFAVWQPGENAGLGQVTEPPSLSWVELHVAEPAAVRGFYRSVLDWTITDMPMGDMTYPVVSPANGDESSSLAGIVELQVGEEVPHWLPYFEVTDCDATTALAQQLGGLVRAPATSVDGVGRFAVLSDPHGIRFAVITSAT